MPANRTRGDYDQLAQIANRFGREAQTAEQTLRSVREQMNMLEGGDWLGQGARAFYTEMNSAVLPSLTRLVRALQSAQRVTAQISREIKVAEDEAAAILKDKGDNTAPPANKGDGGDKGLLGQIGGFFEGMWEGAKGMVTGLWEVITHPIDTIKGLYYGITHPDKLWDALTQPFVEDWQSGNYGRAIGRGTFEVLMLLVPGVGEAKAGAKVAEVANVAGKVAKASELASAIAKGEKFAEAANLAAKTEKAAELSNIAAKVEEGAGAAAKARGVLATSVETQQAFKAVMGEAKYNRLASEVEAIKAAHPEFAHIPTSDLTAIRGYTTNDYKFLNPALRNNDAAELARLKPYIESTVAGLEQLPDHSGTVFRGTQLTDAQIAKYVPGKVMAEETFLSTSSEATAAFPGNAKFIVESQTGKNISRLSDIVGEQEVLFKPGTRFRTLANTTDPLTGETTILLREVP